MSSRARVTAEAAEGGGDRLGVVGLRQGRHGRRGGVVERQGALDVHHTVPKGVHGDGGILLFFRGGLRGIGAIHNGVGAIGGVGGRILGRFLSLATGLDGGVGGDVAVVDGQAQAGRHALDVERLDDDRRGAVVVAGPDERRARRDVEDSELELAAAVEVVLAAAARLIVVQHDGAARRDRHGGDVDAVALLHHLDGEARRGRLERPRVASVVQHVGGDVQAGAELRQARRCQPRRLQRSGREGEVPVGPLGDVDLARGEVHELGPQHLVRGHRGGEQDPLGRLGTRGVHIAVVHSGNLQVSRLDQVRDVDAHHADAAGHLAAVARHREGHGHVGEDYRKRALRGASHRAHNGGRALNLSKLELPERAAGRQLLLLLSDDVGGVQRLERHVEGAVKRHLRVHLQLSWHRRPRGHQQLALHTPAPVKQGIRLELHRAQVEAELLNRECVAHVPHAVADVHRVGEVARVHRDHRHRGGVGAGGGGVGRAGERSLHGKQGWVAVHDSLRVRGEVPVGHGGDAESAREVSLDAAAVAADLARAAVDLPHQRQVDAVRCHRQVRLHGGRLDDEHGRLSVFLREGALEDHGGAHVHLVSVQVHLHGALEGAADVDHAHEVTVRERLCCRHRGVGGSSGVVVDFSGEHRRDVIGVVHDSLRGDDGDLGIVDGDGRALVRKRDGRRGVSPCREHAAQADVIGERLAEEVRLEREPVDVEGVAQVHLQSARGADAARAGVGEVLDGAAQDEGAVAHVQHEAALERERRDLHGRRRLRHHREVGGAAEAQEVHVGEVRAGGVADVHDSRSVPNPPQLRQRVLVNHRHAVHDVWLRQARDQHALKINDNARDHQHLEVGAALRQLQRQVGVARRGAAVLRAADHAGDLPDADVHVHVPHHGVGELGVAKQLHALVVHGGGNLEHAGHHVGLHVHGHGGPQGAVLGVEQETHGDVGAFVVLGRDRPLERCDQLPLAGMILSSSHRRDHRRGVVRVRIRVIRGCVEGGRIPKLIVDCVETHGVGQGWHLGACLEVHAGHLDAEDAQHVHVGLDLEHKLPGRHGAAGVVAARRETPHVHGAKVEVHAPVRDGHDVAVAARVHEADVPAQRHHGRARRASEGGGELSVHLDK
mmetsp:Transcript_15789/g.38415  ORF Transcript_15789/g.38415 Transcript_15789/m.38415 type:complete len:1117 (-) Transcript_15789:5207-8557(-)